MKSILTPSISRVAAEIRRTGATIWLLQPVENGTVIRAENCRKQFRVAVGIPGKKAAPVVPAEANSVLHIARELPGLIAFLSTICQQKNG